MNGISLWCYKMEILCSENKINVGTQEENYNTTSSRVFLTNFKVFGNIVQHCLECLKL